MKKILTLSSTTSAAFSSAVSCPALRMLSVLLCVAVLAACSGKNLSTTAPNSPVVSSGFKKDDVRAILEKVAHWQMARDSSKWAINEWVVGACFVGMTEYAMWNKDEAVLAALKKHCESVDWKLGRVEYHADFHTIGQTYLMFYEMEKDPVMLAGVKERFDKILANPSQAELVKQDKTRWDWCDALFMAPPVWAHLSEITGDPRYLDFMHQEYMFTTDYLYDKEEHLYYRDHRYFDQREANGKKVFWSRGDGWVFAGLCRILEHMPKDYPHRARYEQIFREMAAKLVAILPADNLWHPSLLDPVTYPGVETSGSGFFLYGLAWGVNNGLLDADEYMPTIRRVWPALTACVHEDGKLGFVQPIGAAPKATTANQTQLYGVGAFLLAGLEIYKMSE